MDYNYYAKITSWLKEQWKELTLEHILYLMAFSFILSYVIEYIMKFKHFRWLYYSISVALLFKLFEDGHPVSGVETVYKLALI